MPELTHLIDLITGREPHRVLDGEPAESVCSDETAALIRQAGADGAVLLKNEAHALPLAPGETVAVFGRAQIHWFFVGYGSGGNVLAKHRLNLIEGLEQDGVALDGLLRDRYALWCAGQKQKSYLWGRWPFSNSEMPVSRDEILSASRRADTALVVLGRNAGEDRDMTLTKGSYYLTDEELTLLETVSRTFKKTVAVLNTSNLIDLGWLSRFPGVKALLVCWQAGQESGLCAADILTGHVCPSGRLAASWAEAGAYPGMDDFTRNGSVTYEEDVYMGYRHFDRAREKLLFPFGFGLSYTDFTLTPGAFARTDTGVTFTVTVRNTGAVPGRETAQLYMRPPQDAPLTLIDYKKTRLLAPGEEETLTLAAEDALFASFDPDRHAFVLREGEYRVLYGTDALTENEAGRFTLGREVTVRQCAPLDAGKDFVPAAPLPAFTGAVTLNDVKAGRATMEQFLASLSNEELERLGRGEGGMESDLGVSGNAGVIGGVCDTLREKGVRPIVTSDGPAGLRLLVRSSLFPCGTLLACTFDDALTERLLACMGREARAVGADIVLGPGMNLQRNPLNGRNFEYYSEDPLLSGRMAAAAVRGLQSAGVAACPKHFCCNNKENGRKQIDSGLSERALRELYLKNFELCLKYSDPLCLMTSYNRINSVFACYNYPLVSGVVRREWGYTGLIMTDWWMAYEPSPYFPGLKNNPARIRAGVNVLMPGNRKLYDKSSHNDKETLAAVKKGLLGRGELEQNARYALELQLKLDR